MPRKCFQQLLPTQSSSYLAGSSIRVEQAAGELGEGPGATCGLLLHLGRHLVPNHRAAVPPGHTASQPARSRVRQCHPHPAQQLLALGLLLSSRWAVKFSCCPRWAVKFSCCSRWATEFSCFPRWAMKFSCYPG